jgi:uncharacterized membrane protein YfhO
MHILFLVLLILVLGGLIFTGFETRKTVKAHRQAIEHLQLTIVEMTRKQSVLSEKVQLATGFKSSSQSNIEKLNAEIFELCDLLMKTSETQIPQDK